MRKRRTRWPWETRVKLVAIYEELCRQNPHYSARQFCRYSEVPYSTFCRWLVRWRKRGRLALLDAPRKPRRCPTALSGQEVTLIRRAHEALGFGVHRLHAALKRIGAISRSLSSVYRVLKRCGALVRRPRKPKPVWIRYAKTRPGERAQMDLKYLPEGRFQLTLIDACSRFLAATILDRRTTRAVCQTLPYLLQSIPFRLRCIQTDNGSEFGRELTSLLRGLGIRHARTRPRMPRLNGKVERVQRTMQEEFWDGAEAASLTDWREQLHQYVHHYNRSRLHSALQDKTPWEYAHQRLAQADSSLT